MAQQPLIASFVVRLFQSADGESPPRVTVRHVQTGAEQRFLRLKDALAFIEQSAEAEPKNEEPSR